MVFVFDEMRPTAGHPRGMFTDYQLVALVIRLFYGFLSKFNLARGQPFLCDEVYVYLKIQFPVAQRRTRLHTTYTAASSSSPSSRRRARSRKTLLLFALSAFLVGVTSGGRSLRRDIIFQFAYFSRRMTFFQFCPCTARARSLFVCYLFSHLALGHVRSVTQTQAVSPVFFALC
jgi:hypothetical protein